MSGSSTKTAPRVSRVCKTCGKEFTVLASRLNWKPTNFCSRSCLRGPLVAERFFDNIGKKTIGGCIPWTGGRNRDGYGIIRNDDGKRVLGHRVAYEIMHGPIPDGLRCCHKCDHPWCVNPSHIFLGTDADNASDKAAKGRQCLGEKNTRAKIKEEDVRSIRKQSRAGVASKELARQFGIGVSTVMRIISRKYWKHVTE